MNKTCRAEEAVKRHEDNNKYTRTEHGTGYGRVREKVKSGTKDVAVLQSFDATVKHKRSIDTRLKKLPSDPDMFESMIKL